MTWEGAAFSPGTEWSLLWTAKKALSDTDARAVIQKVLGAGITATASTATLSLIPEDTLSLRVLTLYWDLKAQCLATGEIRTVASGTWTLKRSVGRSCVPSIPIYTTTAPALMGAPGAILQSDEGFEVTLRDTLKTFNANTATIDDITDLLATLISTLKSKNIV